MLISENLATSVTHMKKYSFVHVFLPLLIGSGIYIFFRSPSLMVFNWIDNIGLYNLVFEIRQVTQPMKNILPDWFLFSLPDSLWVYSFTFFMLSIWYNSKQTEKFFWIPLGAILGIGGELAQSIKIIPGTFDIKDLLFCSVAAITPILIIKRGIKNEET